MAIGDGDLLDVAFLCGRAGMANGAGYPLEPSADAHRVLADHQVNPGEWAGSMDRLRGCLTELGLSADLWDQSLTAL